jgi:superfamily I DNA/RNA helicase
VEGPPGSGKTLISLYAIRDLVNNRNITPLVLMYNHSLHGYLKSSFRELGIADNITMATKDIFFWEMARANYIDTDNGYDYKSKYDSLLTALLNKNLSQKWDVAVVDEVQDLTKKEWKLLKVLAGNIISLGDFNQKIYDTDLERYHVSNGSREEKLTDIFRFHKNIARLAGKFARRGDDLEQKVTKVEQKQPIIIDVSSVYEEAGKVAEILNTLHRHQSRTGIIAPSKERLQTLHDVLQNKNIETAFFMNNRDLKEYDFSSNTPLLITAHSAKGLEFENVIVLGFDNSIKERFRNELDELIYVSLTRANSGLYLIRNNDTIDKLRSIKTEEKTSVEVDDIFSF